MKRLSLLSLVAACGLFLTNCQRNQVTHTIKPPVQSYAAIETEKAATAVVSPVTEEVAGNVSETVVTESKKSVATPVIVASAKETRQNKQQVIAQKLMANPKVREFANKIEVTKDAAGNQMMVAKEGKKLNMIEKMVVKKANKTMAQPNKGFKDWNKFLRWGVILLAVSLIISIIFSVGSLWVPGLWALNSLLWLAGVILFVYGLGLELEWW